MFKRVAEDQRFLAAQALQAPQFSLAKTKRQLTFSNLQNFRNKFKVELKVDVILETTLRRSLFWRYLRDEGLLQLLLAYDCCQELKELPPSPLLRMKIKKFIRKFLTIGGVHFIDTESAESLGELQTAFQSILIPIAHPETPTNELEMAQAYLLDRMNDHVGPFIEGPYGYAMAAFENYASKPRTIKDFEKLRLLGEGGFGKVYAVQAVDTGAVWALKEMNKARIITKRRLTTVVNEAGILRKLDHPFVARIHQVFQDEISIYFLLDILPGGDMKFHLKRMSVIPHKVAQFWAACLVLGVKYLHSRNVIHRDLKPSNCILDESGFVVICDFGLSTTAETKDDLKHDQCCGTPGYIAPEMYLGPCWDRRRAPPQPTSKKGKSNFVTQFQTSMKMLTMRKTKIDIFDPSIGENNTAKNLGKVSSFKRLFTKGKSEMQMKNTVLAPIPAVKTARIEEVPMSPTSPKNPLFTNGADDIFSGGSPANSPPNSPGSPNIAVLGGNVGDKNGGLMKLQLNGSNGWQSSRKTSSSGQDEIDRFPRYPHYGVSVDWFAFGVVLHQMYCLGRLPFTRGPKRSHRVLLRNMIQGRVRWNEIALQNAERNRNELLRRQREPNSNPKPLMGLTYDAQDLVQNLLHHDPEQRLGCGPQGVQEVMDHHFFEGIDWEKLEKKHVHSPFLPETQKVNAEVIIEEEKNEHTRKEKRRTRQLTDDHHRQQFRELEYVRQQTLFQEFADCNVNFEVNEFDRASERDRNSCTVM